MEGYVGKEGSVIHVSLDVVLGNRLLRQRLIVFGDKGIVSTMLETGKKDFSNIAIENLDIEFAACVRALINSPQLDRYLGDGSNVLRGNTPPSRGAEVNGSVLTQ